jgi:hypothetical protein
MVLMHYIVAGRSSAGRRSSPGGMLSDLARSHTSRTIVALRLHVVVNRHTVTMLRQILVTSAPMRLGDLLMVESESGHTGLGNFASKRKNIHVTPGQHVTLAPILH